MDNDNKNPNSCPVCSAQPFERCRSNGFPGEVLPHSMRPSGETLESTKTDPPPQTPSPTKVSYVLGFCQKVPAGETAIVKASPVIPFYASRLIVSSNIEASFVLLDILVNGQSVLSGWFTGESGVMCLMFSETAPHIPLPPIETRSRGETIELKVKSLASEDITFIASMIGIGIREGS